MPRTWTTLPTVRLAETDSTQNTARALAEAGAPEGTVVWAEHQTHGRGRLGRAWLDEPGSNLLISTILRPESRFSQLPQLSLVAGVAVAEAIRGETGLPVTLAWPNDLLIHGRKVAGILAESFAPDDDATLVILGVGINVNQTRFPADLAGQATSLALEAGRPFDRERLLSALVHSLEAWYRRWQTEGFAAVREAWVRASETLGERVAIEEGVEGVAVDLAEDGALLVRTDTGALVRQVTGEVTRGGSYAAGD